MNIRRLAESPLVFEDHKVQGREMYERSGCTVVHLLLEENGVLPPVSQADDTFIYVLSGEGKVRIGNDSYTAEPNMIIRCPVDVPHGAENTRKEPFSLLIVKLPTRTP